MYDGLIERDIWTDYAKVPFVNAKKISKKRLKFSPCAIRIGLCIHGQSARVDWQRDRVTPAAHLMKGREE